MKTTHLSGPRITIGDRSIQRCSICGEKLCDSKGQMGVVGPDGEPPKFNYWEPGRFIEVTSGNPSH